MRCITSFKKISRVQPSRSTLHCFYRLYIEAEENHVSVGDDVFLAFTADKTFFLGGIHVAAGDQIIKCHDLRANESALEIAVNFACCLRCLGTAADRPGAYFLRAGSQIADQTEQGIARLDQTVQAALFNAEFCQEFYFSSGESSLISASIPAQTGITSACSARAASQILS